MHGPLVYLVEILTQPSSGHVAELTHYTRTRCTNGSNISTPAARPCDMLRLKNGRLFASTQDLVEVLLGLPTRYQNPVNNARLTVVLSCSYEVDPQAKRGQQEALHYGPVLSKILLRRDESLESSLVTLPSVCTVSTGRPDGIVTSLEFDPCRMRTPSLPGN